MNQLKREKQLAVIHQLVEGSSVRSTERITGVHRDTICRLLVRVGKHCQSVLDRELRDLELRHVQADEMWTFVQKKQARVRVDDPRQAQIGDQYLWIALDEDTKLIPAFAVGKRTADMARRFMVDLASRLKFPRTHEADDHVYQLGQFRKIVQVSTDAFPAYPEAVDLAFGPHVDYGQIIKSYRNAEMPGRYAAPEMVGTERREIFGNVPLSEICTSHVERVNLSVRTFVRRFTRLALGFSKKKENLIAAVQLHVAHYNFCRRHSSLRMTPAMAAGVTGTLWSLEDLLRREQG